MKRILLLLLCLACVAFSLGGCLATAGHVANYASDKLGNFSKKHDPGLVKDATGFASDVYGDAGNMALKSAGGGPSISQQLADRDRNKAASSVTKAVPGAGKPVSKSKAPNKEVSAGGNPVIKKVSLEAPTAPAGGK